MKIELTVEEFKKIFGEQKLTHEEFVEMGKSIVAHKKRGRPKRLPSEEI